ncbi:hypothetical protein LXL04_008032 [Taraxacum kok-saghyz]
MDGGGDVAMTPAGLDWKFSVDVISAIEFDKAGDHLATGDRGGRVVLFERTDQTNEWIVPAAVTLNTDIKPNSKFDYLKSLEIEEKINKIKWCQTSNSSLFLLSTNDKTIKFWKVQEKKIKKICNFNLDPSKQLRNGFICSSNAPTSLRLPMVTSHDTSLLARCRRTFAHAHDYHINSISNNSDGETFISADGLRINLWNWEINSQSFNIVDMKPANMEDLTEVIISADFHHSHCNMLAFSSSKGSIRLLDLRQSALCDNHSKLTKIVRENDLEPKKKCGQCDIMRISKQINKITRLTVISKRYCWSPRFPKRNHSPNKTVAGASRGYPTMLGSFENSYIPENPRTPPISYISQTVIPFKKPTSEPSKTGFETKQKTVHICTKKKFAHMQSFWKKKSRFFGKNFCDRAYI